MSNIPNAKVRYFTLIKKMVASPQFKHYTDTCASKSTPDYRLEGYALVRKDFDGTVKTFVVVQNQSGTGIFSYRVGGDNYRMELASYDYEELFPKPEVIKDEDETTEAKKQTPKRVTKTTGKKKPAPKKADSKD